MMTTIPEYSENVHIEFIVDLINQYGLEPHLDDKNRLSILGEPEIFMELADSIKPYRKRLRTYLIARNEERRKRQKAISLTPEYYVLMRYLINRIPASDIPSLQDLYEQPDTTILCLRAMRVSWDSGRYPVLEKWMFNT